MYLFYSIKYLRNRSIDKTIGKYAPNSIGNKPILNVLN